MVKLNLKKLSQRNIYVEKNMVKSRVNRLLYTGLDFVVCTSVMQKTLEFEVCGAWLYSVWFLA